MNNDFKKLVIVIMFVLFNKNTTHDWNFLLRITVSNCTFIIDSIQVKISKYFRLNFSILFYSSHFWVERKLNEPTNKYWVSIIQLRILNLPTEYCSEILLRT